MKVLSLFDGVSCARLALERAGIAVDAYYASEIDKYAIKVTQANRPDTVQMGSVTDIKGEVFHLSGVYDILKEYDNDIQNKLSEREMLYWLNEDFSISAKIGTQITNADSPESASLQRIEEIWFSRSGVGDIIKTQNLIGSRVGGENGNTQTQELLLQCGEWGYVYRSNTRNQEENIGWVDGKEITTRKYRKDTPISNQTVQQSEISSKTIRDNKDSDVEAREPKEISNRVEKSKEWGASTSSNRKEYARSKVQNVSFPLQTKDVNEAITEREWVQLSVRKEMETTMVKTDTTIDIFLGTFEIMCGGSPCQDLSIAGKSRKGLDGERSGLFWEYVRILKEVKPKYFILENVASMSKEAKAIITEALGVEPIMINAALVSAQQRKRLFWMNIPGVTQPEDRGIYLKDILESGESDRLKSYCIDACYYKGANWEQYKTKGRRQLVIDVLPVALRNRGQGKKPEYNGTGKANALTSVQTDSMVSYIIDTRQMTREGGRGAKTGLYAVALTETRTEEAKKIRKEHMKNGRDYSPRRAKELQPRLDNKSNTITTGSTKESLLLQPDMTIRKLTPIECERLQSMPDNWTNPTGDISNSQRYKMCGNAFNVDVVAHILSFI